MSKSRQKSEPGRQIKTGKLIQKEVRQRGRSLKVRQAEQKAGKLKRKHKRQSDRDGVKMGRYIYTAELMRKCGKR